MSEGAEPRSTFAEWRTPVVLWLLTFVSMMWVGAERFGDPTSPSVLLRGWTFAVPLMAILLSHEMGHYIAGRIHKVEISPPYFIPMPFFLLGTLGAVIRMGEIPRRNALLDVGAAGPLAGMVVALPVMIWGIVTSPVQAIPADNAGMLMEGRGLLYMGLLYALKGPIPDGYDIFLNGPAMAGWAGLLVTQINLIPVAQLDGGHVAYALFGERQDRYALLIHRALPFVGAGVSLVYVLEAYLGGERGQALYGEALAGMHWLVWALILSLMMRLGGKKHPTTGPEPLTIGRKIVAIGTLVLFALLFMPSWMYVPQLW